MEIGKQIADCGGRRFVLVAGASVVHTALFSLHILSESGYLTLTLSILGAYLAANGVQKYHEKK